MIDVVQFMAQPHFSSWCSEEPIRHFSHKDRPFYTMIPMDEWDDGIRECAPIDQSRARVLNNQVGYQTHQSAWWRKQRKKANVKLTQKGTT